MEGMNQGESRFRDLRDVPESETESTEEEYQAGSSEGEIIEPVRKKAKLQEKPAPKWSNPDPYTVLPPPEESTGVRRDVVKFIRKAKASETGTRTSIATNDDFISFDLDDTDGSSDNIMSNSRPTNGIPTGPKFSHLDNLHPNRYVNSQDNKSNEVAASGVHDLVVLKIRNVHLNATEDDLRNVFGKFHMSVASTASTHSAFSAAANNVQ